MGFSDHLDDFEQPAGEVEITDDMRRDGVAVGDLVNGQRVVESGVDLAPISGPSPDQLDDVQVVSLTATVQGQKVFPDIPDPVVVEAQIKQLTVADVRGEILLNQEEAAMLVGVTPPTLKDWRDRRINLPYYISPAVGKFRHRRIHYRVADLIRYREFVMSRVSPIGGVHMPPPGLMGTPLPGPTNGL